MPTEAANWMLSEAIDALVRAERLHRQFFQIRRPPGAAEPVWEPPVDVLETEREVLIVIALPGVDPSRVEAVIEDGAFHVSARRVLPSELRGAVIHRLELPQGRFERRIPIPPGRYAIERAAANGCIVFNLRKTA